MIFSSFLSISPGVAADDSRFSVNRAGGVDATGSNRDGNLVGYDARSFSEIANLTAPTLAEIQNRINNLETTVEGNVTSMGDLQSRITAAEGAISTNAGSAARAQARADQAYSLADAAYNRAMSAESKASSALADPGNTYRIRTVTYEVICRGRGVRGELLQNGSVVSTWGISSPPGGNSCGGGGGR